MITRLKLKMATFLFTGSLAAVLLLSACGSRATPAPQDVSPLYTAAAQTVVAQLTQSAPNNPTVQPTSVPNNPESPSETPAASQVPPTATEVAPTATTVPPTATLVPPTATATSVPPTRTPAPTATRRPATATARPTAVTIDTSCYKATFVEDINYPDSTEVFVGTTIYKTWRLKNAGRCTWDENFYLVFTGGDRMGEPKTLPWTFGDVPRNHTVDITIAFQVPEDEGTYTSEWKIVNPKDQSFGVTKSSGLVVPFYVKIDAVQPRIAFDFIAKAPRADWRTASASVRWGNKEREPAEAMIKDSLLLEDGLVYENVLATYPEDIQNGIITGTFQPYTVKANDQFRADFGFRNEVGEDAKVKVSLRFLYEGGVYTLKDWEKLHDGQLENLRVDLGGLAGKTVQFILVVDSDGSPAGDLVVWVNPRIQR